MVYSVRQRCGAELARESGAVNADLVSCVPDSAMAAAMAFAETAKLPFREVMNKSRYVGRTFIQPTREPELNFQYTTCIVYRVSCIVYRVSCTVYRVF